MKSEPADAHGRRCSHRTLDANYFSVVQLLQHGGLTVTAPISIRLDDDVRATLEADAKKQGVGLATYLRVLATDAAREVRRKQIRAQSAAVARYIAEHTEGREFSEFWGTPNWEGL
jgi:hypothetical protein